MMFWANLIGYQLMWFALVIGAARGHAWLAIAAGAGFVAGQLLCAPRALVECRLLLLALVLGMAVDGVSAMMDWLRYATPSPALPPHGAPLWILMLWACFATTINRSLAWLRPRPWLAAVIGAVGAPLAYLAAARGWQAVTFVEPPQRAMAWLAASWAVSLGLLCMCAQRWNARVAGSNA